LRRIVERHKSDLRFARSNLEAADKRQQEIDDCGESVVAHAARLVEQDEDIKYTATGCKNDENGNQHVSREKL
jgi:hypothetical protein